MMTAYKASWGGLARIALWAAFFLWLAGTLAPEPPPPSSRYLGIAETKQVRMVATIPEDPRYVEFPPQRKGLNIYWVSDSTVAVHHATDAAPLVELDTALVPTFAVKNLQNFLGRQDVFVDVNAQPYLGGVEFYSAAAAAIAAKPDLIVLTVSPFNQLTSHEIVQRPAHLSRASALWARHAKSWPWLFFIPSPANNLWGALGQRFLLIRDASLYKSYLDKFFDKLPHAEKSDNIRTLGGVGRRLVFWFCEGLIKQECPDYFYAGGKKQDMLVWYREKLRVSDIDGKGLTQDAFGKSLEILKDSGIPTLVYQIPVGNFVSAPDTYANLPKFDAILETARAKYAGTNVHIIAKLPDDITRTVRFRVGDSEHISFEGQYPGYIAEQIWNILQQSTGAPAHAE